MRIVDIALAASLALSLAACETATPYQPLQKGSHVAGGFSEQKLDSNHVRVSFKGNTDTPRATVETYLLYRAAELTVQNGYDWFEPVERHTDRDKRTFVDPDPFYGPGYGWGYFRPSWSFYGPRGWGPWGPYGYGWGGGATVSTVQEFQATAEIAMGHGAKPTDNPRAMDAREVMTNLGPKIQRPVPGK